MKELPENIQVICKCGRVLMIGIKVKEEDGFKCFCSLPIVSPTQAKE